MTSASEAEVPTLMSFGLWVRHCCLLLPPQGARQSDRSCLHLAHGLLEDTELGWVSLAPRGLSRAGRMNKRSFILFSRDLTKGHRSIHSQKHECSWQFSPKKQGKTATQLCCTQQYEPWEGDTFLPFLTGKHHEHDLKKHSLLLATLLPG